MSRLPIAVECMFSVWVSVGYDYVQVKAVVEERAQAKGNLTTKGNTGREL